MDVPFADLSRVLLLLWLLLFTSLTGATQTSLASIHGSVTGMETTPSSEPFAVIGSTSSPGRREPGPIVSQRLFAELEQLSRLVGAAYCVGNQGLKYPFECGSERSWCEGFEGLQLVETWNLGLLDSASCGYVAISHQAPYRIIVAFRGSNSLSDALYDLMTRPATYEPLYFDGKQQCSGCTVHSGFMSLWNATRELLLPVLEGLIAQYPAYELILTGHSMGGAIAGLAALESVARGWKPVITTFGEPRFGNSQLAAYVDQVLVGTEKDLESRRYRRVTHIGDPVPLLPFQNLGWKMHGGEIFIETESLPALRDSVWHCSGPNDPNCIQGTSSSASKASNSFGVVNQGADRDGLIGLPGFPAEWRLWEILFSHRQYFWRIGLCWDPQGYNYSLTPGQMPDQL